MRTALRPRNLLAGALGAALALWAWTIWSPVWAQPFVVPPQPVVVTNTLGTASALITATAGGAVQVECVGGTCGGGAVTANQGTPAVQANRWPVFWSNGATERGLLADPIRVDPTGTTTQPVSGTIAATQSGAWTVTTTPPANASTNVTQFGGNAVVTGTGASGVGIPRVTVANDSTVILGAGAATIGSLAANQSTNVAQFGGNAVVTGTGASGVGIPRVTIANDSSLAANQSVNLAQVAGTATVNGGLAGSQAVGGTAANNAAINQNPVLVGAEVLSQGTQPTAATSANQRRLLATTEGVLYVQHGNSNRFSCFVQAVTVTTQCQAAPAAGLRAYVVSATLSNQAATVQTLDIIFGTGVNCATAPTALTHKWQFGTLATTTSPIAIVHTFTVPLIPTAANAICVRPSLATAFGATLTGYIAP